MDKIPELNRAVAEVITKQRIRAGFTQAQLAGFAGLSEDYISVLERGKQAGSLTSMAHIAMALKIDLADLIREIEVTKEKYIKAKSRLAY